MNNRAWIYAGLLVAAGIGLASASKPSAPRAVPGQARVLLLGDSLSVGIKTPMSLLAKESNIQFAHCGKQGYTIDRFVTGDMAPCVKSQLANLKPTHVLILLGTNDEAMSGSLAARQVAHAKTLVDTCRASGSEVIWIAPAKKFERSNGVLVGLRAMFDDAHWFASDALNIPLFDSIGHMTPINYCRWSGAIWNWLTKIAVAPNRCG